MTGWTKKPRARFKHHLFKGQKFCRGYAWDWLCDHAAFKPMKIDKFGKSVALDRGQLCYSVRDLAAAWNWDKAAVSRYLTRLKTETMIKTQTETGVTIITICKYETFNATEIKPETRDETLPDTEARQYRDSTETQKKNYKKDKKENTGSDDLFSDQKNGAQKETPLSILREVVPEDRAKAFIEYRKKARKPLTADAAKLAAVKLRSMPDPVASINQTILNGWTGIFPVSGPSQLQGQRPSILKQIENEERQREGQQ